MRARTSARVSSLSLPVDSRSSVEFRGFRSRTPLLSLSAGRVLVTLTLPERLRAEDVEFARRLAEQTAAYAVEGGAHVSGRPASLDGFGSGGVSGATFGALSVHLGAEARIGCHAYPDRGRSYSSTGWASA